ncbi:MAG: DUF433 domain-containing protein [Chloroflexi bacterium]|nr:DUF433 domain-containing protein [Chloroflexota bacterium]MCC6897250.1 DUF433 domain-containing protein [Anaerolineae bacterium]
MATIHPIDTIMSDPNNRGGQPIIAGTSIRVIDVVASHIYRGLLPEELAVNFALDMGQVYAALAYYYQHKTDMDTKMRSDAAESQRLLTELEAQGKLIHLSTR